LNKNAPYLLPQQPRRPQPHHLVQQHALPGIKPEFSVGSLPAIQRDKELPNLVLRADGLLELSALELQLVREVRGAGPDEVLERLVLARRGHEGHADGEDVRDEVGVPEGDAVDECGSPAIDVLVDGRVDVFNSNDC